MFDGYARHAGERSFRDFFRLPPTKGRIMTNSWVKVQSALELLGLHIDTELSWWCRTDVLGETWVGRIDGTHLRRITRQIHAGNPAYSPDGSKIVFNDGIGNLLVMDPDRSNVKTILSCTEGCPLPDWGAKIK